MLQASQTWRGRLSPAGTLRVTGAPQLGQNFIGADAVETEVSSNDTSRRSQPAVDVIPAVAVLRFVGAVPLRFAQLLPTSRPVERRDRDLDADADRCCRRQGEELV